jgi:hypothetical protein
MEALHLAIARASESRGSSVDERNISTTSLFFFSSSSSISALIPNVKSQCADADFLSFWSPDVFGIQTIRRFAMLLFC